MLNISMVTLFVCHKINTSDLWRFNPQEVLKAVAIDFQTDFRMTNHCLGIIGYLKTC